MSHPERSQARGAGSVGRDRRLDDVSISDEEAVAAIARVRRRNRRGQVAWDRALRRAYAQDPVPGTTRRA